MPTVSHPIVELRNGLRRVNLNLKQVEAEIKTLEREAQNLEKRYHGQASALKQKQARIQELMQRDLHDYLFRRAFYNTDPRHPRNLLPELGVGSCNNYPDFREKAIRHFIEKNEREKLHYSQFVSNILDKLKNYLRIVLKNKVPSDEIDTKANVIATHFSKIVGSVDFKSTLDAHEEYCLSGSGLFVGLNGDQFGHIKKLVVALHESKYLSTEDMRKNLVDAIKKTSTRFKEAMRGSQPTVEYGVDDSLVWPQARSYIEDSPGPVMQKQITRIINGQLEDDDQTYLNALYEKYDSLGNRHLRFLFKNKCPSSDQYLTEFNDVFNNTILLESRRQRVEQFERASTDFRIKLNQKHYLDAAKELKEIKSMTSSIVSPQLKREIQPHEDIVKTHEDLHKKKCKLQQKRNEYKALKSLREILSDAIKQYKNRRDKRGKKSTNDEGLRRAQNLSVIINQCNGSASSVDDLINAIKSEMHRQVKDSWGAKFSLLGWGTSLFSEKSLIPMMLAALQVFCDEQITKQEDAQRSQPSRVASAVISAVASAAARFRGANSSAPSLIDRAKAFSTCNYGFFNRSARAKSANTMVDFLEPPGIAKARGNRCYRTPRRCH